MRRFTFFLFYLLILFIPTQLSRHFFFDFSSISGIRSDYLAPTIYFTDIIILLLICTEWIARIKDKKNTKHEARSSKQYQNPNNKNSKLFRISDFGFRIFLFVICYLLFNTIFVAANKWAAFYRFVKIIELILLGFTVYRLKPKLSTIISILSIGILYSSVIAVWQFLIQKSTGAFWWIGERTFYSATPGIAAFSYKGSLLLRPYATFPHPNVLGGFLAVILPLVFLNLISCWYANNKFQKIWSISILLLGFSALILSFSRAAWFVAGLGFIIVLLERKYRLLQKLKAKKGRVLFIFYLSLLLSVMIPVFLPKSYFSNLEYWQERVTLIQGTISLVSSNLLFGVGLNNFITQLHNYVAGFPGLFIFQPVHNIYLLVLAETGIAGLTLFLSALMILFNRLINSRSILFLTFMQLFILGLFDHYLVTLQQSQLMLVIFTALSFVPKVAY